MNTTELVSWLSSLGGGKYFCEIAVHTDESGSLPEYICGKVHSCLLEECKNNSPKDTSKCTNCNLVVSKYIIYNLTQNSSLEYFKDENGLLNNYSSFKEFQSEHISKIFFGENIYVKFSTYVVFITEKRNAIPAEVVGSVSRDLDYARKLFFTLDDFNKWLTGPIKDFALRGKSNNSEHENMKIAVRALIEILEKHNMWTVLIDDRDSTEREILLQDHVEGKNKYDNNNPEIKDKSKEYHYTPLAKPTKQREKIHKLSMKNYIPRIFGEERSFNFRLMNMIYAANGSGKTSLLDSIAFALTGSGAEEKIKGADVDCTMKDESGNDKTYTSSGQRRYSGDNRVKFNTRRKNWYPKRFGSLVDLFYGVNYFRIDAAIRFTQEKRVDGRLLKLLFADTDFEELYERFIWLREFISNKLKRYDDIMPTQEILDLLTKNTIKISQDSSQWMERCNHIANERKYLSNLLSDFDDVLRKFKNIDILSYYNEQIENNVKLINAIYQTLHSYDEEITFKLVNDDNKPELSINFKYIDDPEELSLDDMSAAQRASLALAVMFSQFLKSETAPGFVMLDEPIAYLDDLHLLNLFDFLRSMVFNNYQVILAATRNQIAEIAAVKFHCLGREFIYYNLDRDVQ